MLNASYVTCRLHVCIRYYVSQQRPGLNLSEPQPHVRNSTTAPTVWTFFLCKKIFFMSQFNHQLLGFITPLYLAFHTCQNTSNLSECGFFSPSLRGIFKWPENGPKKLLRIELEVSLSDKKNQKTTDVMYAQKIIIIRNTPDLHIWEAGTNRFFTLKKVSITSFHWGSWKFKCFASKMTETIIWF